MTSLGLVLLVVGALVAVSEAHRPSHGIAGAAGVVILAVGAVLTISGLGAGIVLGLLGGVALGVAGAGVVVLSVTRGLAVRRRRVRTGAEGLIGHIGTVRSWSEEAGSVVLDGAVWRARRSPSPDGDADEATELHAGDSVVVERLTGLTLSVRRAEEWELL